MRLTELAHRYLAQHLQAGDHAIDATAGNGYDSRYMAERIGPNGQLLAIDIQAAAIDATRARLERAGCLAQTELRVADHATTLSALCASRANSIRAITFNLGYLPGSDKQIQTQPASTLEALHAACQLLQGGGLLLVTAYRGHRGGDTEATAIAAAMQQLGARGWSIDSHTPTAPSKRVPPVLWVAHKPQILPSKAQQPGQRQV